MITIPCQIQQVDILISKKQVLQIPYTWNFSRHVYFTVEHETRIFAVEISRMKVIQKFSRFSRLQLQGYVPTMYATNLSEIDKTLYQIVYHSRGNPRPPCGKSWD